jgi:HEAT repeat protein
VNDELLHELEQDFVSLLQQSDHVEQLLEAEELLIATNDNTHWTNYSAATRILRRDREIAAIPLLLRYIVLHSKRSSCHVMIPEYRKTIATISGHELPRLYEPGPDLEARMRSKVLDIVNDWWRKAKTKLVTDPAVMSPGQLQVLVTNMLNEVRYKGDFTGSGGRPDSAYGAYHNVYYRVVSSSSYERVEISPLHPKMIPLLLAPSGYRSDQKTNLAAKGSFPYETIWILAEFVKNGHQAMIQKVAADTQQNSIVRMVCILALFRAGHEFRTDSMIKILEHETDLERRLIALLSLRWAGAAAVPVLLKHMDDANFEIATAAACALADAKPKEAIGKFEAVLDRHHVSAPLLMYGALAKFKSSEARALFTRLLTDAVEGKKNSQHIYRLLGAFADAWEIPRSAYHTQGDREYKRQAKLALAYSREMLKQQQAELRKLAAVVDSLQTQLKVGQQIETLRRSEYKRLLGLQGDEIVTAEESEQAFTLLQTAAAEVKMLRSKLAERESKLEALLER